MRFVAAVLGACVWLGTLGAAPPSFAYDAFAPLEYQVDATTTDAGVETSQVSFRSSATLMHALLVLPDKPAGSMPGVLFVHGTGDPQSVRAEFLPDARWLARRGVASLLADEPWSRPEWLANRSATSPGTIVSTVVSLRRCLDVLEKTPGVDPKRLAFVGRDFGAAYGALLAAADPRPAWFALMAPDLHSSGAAPPADEIFEALRRATFSGSLTQFAKRDGALTAEDAQTFVRALPAGDRTVDTYDATPALAIDAATDDRRQWLGRRLGLSAL